MEQKRVQVSLQGAERSERMCCRNGKERQMTRLKHGVATV